MTKTFKYKAFISYSHADEAQAGWLHKALETYRIPKSVVVKHGLHSNRLGTIFRDREDLASASSLSNVIREALAESENLVVICSADAARSAWVNEEIIQFKALGKADRVFCILFGDPAASFPPAALVDVDRDGVATSEETEPLAADARPEGDGRSAAKVKVIAGLLGLDLDEIRRRDAQRRHRQLSLIAGGALAGMAVAIALSIWAIFAEQEAQTERARAEIEQKRAETEQERAEHEAAVSQEVTDFLVGLFADSNPFSGAMESAEPLSARELLDRGLERVDTDLASRPVVQARVLAAIGMSFFSSEDRATDEKAERLMRRSIAMLERMGDESTLLLARTYYEFGSQMLSRDSGVALEALQKSLELRELELGREHPDVAESLFGLGRIHSIDNQAIAEEMLREGIAVLELTDPDGELLPNILAFLGAMISFYDGRSAEAVPLIDRSIELRERQIRPDEPATLGYAGQLMNAASVYMDEGLRLEKNGSEPTEYFTKALQIYERTLAAYEEALAPGHPLIGMSLWGLANAKSSIGQYDEAEMLFQRALVVLEASNSGYLTDLLTEYANHKQRRGAFDDAEAILQRALTTARAHHPGRITAVEDLIREFADARNARDIRKLRSID